MKYLFMMVSVFLGVAESGKAALSEEFKGCDDLCRNFQSILPTRYLSEEDLELEVLKLFETFEKYEATEDFLKKNVLLNNMRKSLQILHSHDYLDSDIIMLAGEIDSMICANSDEK